MLDLYRNFIKPGDVVFDIGANVGDRTRIFRALGARVVAVEPQSVCIRRLQATFASDDLVTVVPAAVGRTVGEAVMHTSQAHIISSLSTAWLSNVQQTGRFGPHRWDREETVRVVTMDSLISEYGRPAFCKIDVEGFEAEVLAGLSTELPALSFECTPEFGSNTAACIARLAELGAYEYNLSVGETMRFEFDRWVDADTVRRAVDKIDPHTYADMYARRRRP